MAAGVQQDRGLTEPLQSMADLTDVGMEKEDHGPMTFIRFQVTRRFFWKFFISQNYRRVKTSCRQISTKFVHKTLETLLTDFFLFLFQPRNMQISHHKGQLLFVSIHVSRAPIQSLRQDSARKDLVRNHPWLQDKQTVGILQGRRKTT